MTITEQALREVALTISEYNQIVELLRREPSPVELGMFGAMWSEHCGYKHSRPLLRMFSTDNDRVLQGPGENAGVVDIGDGLGAAFKIESHNHPSAIEPYQGAATGVGGIVRDVFTMGARPVALLNSLHFGPLDSARNRYLFSGVVGGIGGYGNCLGIPTVAGDIFFADSYSSNPLVNAMCVGIVRHDMIMRARASGPGNLVIVVGADTGRDGIHGATFASVDDPESSHRGVVQVGNPFLEKLLLEACLELLETDHVVAMQDLGAAGLTSSIVECASSGEVGIEIDVAKVSRREEGMNAYEVMLSESQERMLVIVREEGLESVREIFDRWDLHSDVVGTVTDDGMVRILDDGEVVANVPASLYTDECPTYVRPSQEDPRVIELRAFIPDVLPDLDENRVEAALLKILGSHNICSREPVVRTYDHTIMSNTTLPPGAGDAAVIRIKGTDRGLAMKTDCNSRYVYLHPRKGGMHAVSEAARNVACTGARPLALTNCLNFGNPEKPEVYFQLEQAITGMAEAARALDTPVVSGNVSLYNETGSMAVWPTPVVGMIGLLEQVSRRIGMAARPDSVMLLLGPADATLGASEYLATMHDTIAGDPPDIDLDREVAVQHLVIDLADEELILAAHDCSEGGLAVTVAEMLIAGNVGLTMSVEELLRANGDRLDRTLFGEAASRVVVAVHPDRVGQVEKRAAERDVGCFRLGECSGNDLIIDQYLSVAIETLERSWSDGLRIQGMH
ncbi:phosphoribosylformylglycinamidine synthase subunit PurL [soil metagenome]